MFWVYICLIRNILTRPTMRKPFRAAVFFLFGIIVGLSIKDERYTMNNIKFEPVFSNQDSLCKTIDSLSYKLNKIESLINK